MAQLPWAPVARRYRAKVGANDIMLWTLLTLTSSATLVASAVISAKHAQAGLGSYSLAIIIGLLLAVCNAWTMYKVGGTLADRSKRYSESVKEWRFRALYLAATLWIPLAAFLGDWVTSAAIRLAV